MAAALFPRTIPLLLAGLGLAAGACAPPGGSRRAENVPAEPLPVAADTLTLPWANLPEAAWLGGRTWALVGADHDAAVVVNFATDEILPLGGPDGAELTKPFGVFALGDTAVVADWSKGRLTLWSPAGQLLGEVPAPAATRGVLPKARDAAGQYYFEIPPIAGPDGSGLRDSAAIVRANPALTTFDTIARLAPPDVAEIAEARGKRYERLVFSGNDWWGVRPDGRLWIGRVWQNQVSTVDGRRERRGERLPDPVLEVTRADREQYINGFPEELRQMAQKLVFAPFKPAFERAFEGGSGIVWLRKAKTASDSVRRYHLVDTTGSLSRVLTTLGPGILVAAGDRSALMAEQFKDGIRLMEIPLPAPPPPPPSN